MNLQILIKSLKHTHKISLHKKRSFSQNAKNSFFYAKFFPITPKDAFEGKIKLLG